MQVSLPRDWLQALSTADHYAGQTSSSHDAHDPCDALEAPLHSAEVSTAIPTTPIRLAQTSLSQTLLNGDPIPWRPIPGAPLSVRVAPAFPNRGNTPHLFLPVPLARTEAPHPCLLRTTPEDALKQRVSGEKRREDW